MSHNGGEWVIVERSRRFWVVVQRKEKWKEVNKVRHLTKRGHDKMSHVGTTRWLAGAKLDDRIKRANRGKVGDLVTEYKRRRGSSTVKRG